MLLKDTRALKISDNTPTLAQVNCKLVGTAAGVLIPEIIIITLIVTSS